MDGAIVNVPLGKRGDLAAMAERSVRAEEAAYCARVKAARLKHREMFAKAREPIKTPNVTKGQHNRSTNASRQAIPTGRVISEMGRRRVELKCPFCLATFWAYVWSLAGGGKKCPNCKAMHTSFGHVYPLEGNEEL